MPGWKNSLISRFRKERKICNRRKDLRAGTLAPPRLFRRARRLKVLCLRLSECPRAITGLRRSWALQLCLRRWFLSIKRRDTQSRQPNQKKARNASFWASSQFSLNSLKKLSSSNPLAQQTGIANQSSTSTRCPRSRNWPARKSPRECSLLRHRRARLRNSEDIIRKRLQLLICLVMAYWRRNENN